MRSTVNGASQSAAAEADTRSSHSMFDSASQTPPPRMHSAIASVASACVRTGQAQDAYLGYVVGVRPGLPVQRRKTPRRNLGAPRNRDDGSKNAALSQ